MAGEAIFLLSGKPPASVDYTAAADGKRGDLVDAGGTPAFLLDDVSANGIVAAAIASDLVSVPQPTTARAWKAGEPVYLTHDREFGGTMPIARARVGYVHHDVPDTETRVPVVWRPGEGHYYQSLNPRTTPAYSLTTVTATTMVGKAVEYTQTLATTSTKGIAPGVPTQVDYEGDLLLRNVEKHANCEFSVGYRMWHDDSTKVATLWTVAFRDARKHVEIGISMDSFSSANVLDVGSPIPNDDGGTTTVTQADFDNGIPVQIILRLRFYKQDTHTERIGTEFDLLEMENPQLVTRQWGSRVQ